MRALTIISLGIALALSAACSSDMRRVQDSELLSPDYRIGGTTSVPKPSGRPLGNLRDSFAHHVEDCRQGMGFTLWSFYRITRENWERTKVFFQ
jgi:hypothetical protein